MKICTFFDSAVHFFPFFVNRECIGIWSEKHLISEGVMTFPYEKSGAWYQNGGLCEHFVSNENWVKQLLGVYGIPFLCHI